MYQSVQVAIIGGGIAGLTAAIHLARAGIEVVLFEKKAFPQHKVCGEYISNEIRTYYGSLGIEIDRLQPNQVNTFRLYTASGKYVESTLPLGGIGLRRYCLDLHLQEKATAASVKIFTETTVQAVQFQSNQFTIQLQKGEPWQAQVVIGSFGKRSNLDLQLKRTFIKNQAPYIGVKFYLENTDFPQDMVHLYNFQGGYGGAVQVEDGTVDVAYLITANALKNAKNLDQFEQSVLRQNPAFASLLNNKRITEKPMTISNISFAPKKLIDQHILMIGDAAGMIPPLCGNGMAMGVHAAKLASEQIIRFLSGQINRTAMEAQFLSNWNKQFKYRLFWGRQLQPFLQKPIWSEIALFTFRKIPGLLPLIIRQTHGQPF